MSALLIIFSLLIAAGIQALLPGWSVMGHVKLPLLLGVTIYFSLTRKRFTAMMVALLAGFLQDTQSLMPLGCAAISFCIVAFTINRYRDEVYIPHPITHVFFGAVTAAIVDVMAALFLILSVKGVNLGLSIVLMRMLGSFLLGAISAPFVYKMVWKMDVALGNLNRRGTAWQ